MNYRFRKVYYMGLITVKNVGLLCYVTGKQALFKLPL